MEFSKKIVLGVAVMTIILFVFTLWTVWRTGDTSPLAWLIPAVFAEAAAATGFYYRKAQAENVKKIEHYYEEG